MPMQMYSLLSSALSCARAQCHLVIVEGDWNNVDVGSATPGDPELLFDNPTLGRYTIRGEWFLGWALIAGLAITSDFCEGPDHQLCTLK